MPRDFTGDVHADVLMRTAAGTLALAESTANGTEALPEDAAGVQLLDAPVHGGVRSPASPQGGRPA